MPLELANDPGLPTTLFNNPTIQANVLEAFSETDGMVEGWEGQLEEWAATVPEQERAKTFLGVSIQFTPSILSYVTTGFLAKGSSLLESWGMRGMAFWLFGPGSPGTMCLRDLMD